MPTELDAATATGAAAALPRSVFDSETLREIPIGRLGMWWFLASEVMIFGGLIISCVLFRVAHGGWAAEAAHVNWRLGAINTLVLVTSSLTMILAFYGVETGDRAGVRRYLGITVMLG